MPFTAQELANIANASLDWYIDKGKVESQSIQDKPLLDAFASKSKTFPSGKDNVSLAVKGEYTTTLTGYTHDDSVNYVNPANIKRVNYPWREHHAGITVTHTELKKDGISVTDAGSNGEKLSSHNDAELTRLVGLWDDKLEDLGEGFDRGLNGFLWGDGTADPKAIAGVRALILDTPAVGVTGGLDRAIFPWWRNRAILGTASAAANGGVLAQVLQRDFRQLTRYAKRRVDVRLFAGADFIDALERELRANGNYTQDGWMNNGRTDAGMADLTFKRKPVVYDPTLDDMGRAKFMYAIDMNSILLYYMDGEELHKHTPARPPEKYVIYQGLTTTGALVARRLNTSGVYSIN